MKPFYKGSPRKTWQEVIRTDLRQKKLRPKLTQSRSDWKSAINITVQPLLAWKMDVKPNMMMMIMMMIHM